MEISNAATVSTVNQLLILSKQRVEGKVPAEIMADVSIKDVDLNGKNTT